jgi:hypothetical protein
MAFKVLSKSSAGPKPKGDNKIIFDNLDQVDKAEPETELAHDVLQIMNVFVAKMNGLRKYKKKKIKSIKSNNCIFNGKNINKCEIS